MPVIHTLGPKETDANLVAESLSDDPNYQGLAIELHSDFPCVYDNLAAYKGDYFLVPVGYQGPQGDSWASQHYQHLSELSIQKTWVSKTMEMLLVENTALSNGKALTHKTTAPLLDEIGQNLAIDYVPAKPMAAKGFLHGDYQYAIFSQNAESQLRSFDRVLDRFQPEMIWCLYKIQ